MDSLIISLEDPSICVLTSNLKIRQRVVFRYMLELLETLNVKILLLIRQIANILTNRYCSFKNSAHTWPSFQEIIPSEGSGIPLAKRGVHGFDIILSEPCK